MTLSNFYAQTNVQLFNQLRCEGYSKQDRQRVLTAYEFALQIFSGLFLPSGKPFIDHLVGTASILASLHRPVEIVAAGLLHAAYLHGDFGAMRAGRVEANRRKVRDALGQDIEEYLDGYDRFAWNPQRTAVLHDTIDVLSAVERNLVLMRLANELEHHLDLGALYFAGGERAQKGHQRYIQRYGSLWVTMAEKLSYPSLAADMDAAFKSIIATEITVAPFDRGNQKVAYLIAPKSYRQRAWVTLWRNPLHRLRTRRIGSAQNTSGTSIGFCETRSKPFTRDSASSNVPVHPYAQTILQLFNQLRREGYSPADLNLVRRAYDLAAVLFTARYQPSGKSFVAHAVGTASILATLHASAPVLAAGLLHNVYEHGDFGSFRPGMSRRKRQRIALLLGPEVEEYVVRFPALGWKSTPVQVAHRNPAALGLVDHNVLLIRLADLLEHLLDLDLVYYAHRIRRYYTSSGPMAIETAERLGLHPLAAEIRETLREIECADAPVELPAWRVKESSFVLVTKSCCKRFFLALCQDAFRRTYSVGQKLRRRSKLLYRKSANSRSFLRTHGTELSTLLGMRKRGAGYLDEKNEDFKALFSGENLARVASGFQFVEGPVWIHEEKKLLISDIPADRIFSLTAAGETTIFRRPSGGSNGLTRDKSGRLIVCEQSNRRLTRTENNGSITVLADRFAGSKLNSPNDAVVKSDGAIYFTDPNYGISACEQEQEVPGVYRLSPDGGELTRVADDFARPNGLAFSPDEKKLYIDDSERRHIRVFDVQVDGSLSGGVIFHDMNVSTPGSPDGMKVDAKGRVFCTGAGGIWVFDKDGKHLGTIITPEKPSNCAWGGADWRTLYITACTSVYAARLQTAGAEAP